jgi:AbiTii
VTKRADHLLNEIEKGAVDSQTPIGDLLRKVIALGGKAGSQELRDWAERELRGYGPDDELPTYRRINAPLKADWTSARGAWIEGETISPLDLPEYVRGDISNDAELRMGIAEIEQLVRSCPPGESVKVTPPGGQEVVFEANARSDRTGVMGALYWGVSPAVLGGVVDQVRTTLTTTVAEINANTPESTVIPSAEVATNALSFAVSGKQQDQCHGALGWGSSNDHGAAARGTSAPADCRSRSGRPDHDRRSGLRPHAGTRLALRITAL